MRPADLALLRTPGTPTVSPDGRMAVVAVSRPDPGPGGSRGQLWAVPTDGSAPARPLTSGGRDSAPAFSPDGRWLAYLSAAADGPPQVHLLPTAGGAPRRLTGEPQGAGAPVWSPDSRRLAWVAPVAPAPPGEGPRLVTGLDARPRAPRTAVVVLDLPADPLDDVVALPAPRPLTDGSGSDTDVAWFPDGRTLVFVSARHPGAERDRVRDVYTVPVAGGRPRRVTRARGECRQPLVDAAGTTIHLTARPDLGPDGRDVAGSPLTSCRVPAGGGELQPVLDPARYPRSETTPPTVLDGAAALVAVERGGAVELLRVPLHGGPPAALVDGPFTVRGCAAAAGVVVVTVAHDRSAGELVAVTPGRRRLLTGFGAALGATGRLHRTEARRAVLPGGEEGAAWVTVPPGDGPHPVLLSVPGGPPGWSLDDEVQVAASAGYAVVRCDPTAAGADVLAVLDATLADPALDAGRVGLAGGPSTASLLARGDRFAAAVLAWDGPAGADPGGAGSLDAGAVVPPTLVVQAERCPLGEGRRLFTALQRRGVPSALLLVPGDGAGDPRHRPARLAHLLDWWDRWLPAGDLPAEDDGAGDLPAEDDGAGVLPGDGAVAG